jgi:hypothetical protein
MAGVHVAIVPQPAAEHTNSNADSNVFTDDVEVNARTDDLEVRSRGTAATASNVTVYVTASPAAAVETDDLENRVRAAIIEDLESQQRPPLESQISLPRSTRRLRILQSPLHAPPGLMAGSPHRSTVHYPPRFKALGVVVLGLSLTWIGNYLLEVLPTINKHHESPCKYNDNQLAHNAKMLFVYFVWFAIARLLLFVPCVAARVAVVQSRTHGFCKTYMVHLVLRDGPLYIFVVGSLLFWFHLMQSPSCEEDSPELYRTLKLYAINSCLLSIFCLVLAYWHNKLLVDALREIFEHDEITDAPTFSTQGAPPDTISRFETRKYDPEIFGDEEGKLYPSECAICLIGWEPDEVIKVTPCDHAFHEECLANWLKTARTCALCRQDITENGGARALGGRGSASPRSSPSSAYVANQPSPESFGHSLEDEGAPAHPAGAPVVVTIATHFEAPATLPSARAEVISTSASTDPSHEAASSTSMAMPSNDLQTSGHPGSSRYEQVQVA